MSARDTAKMIRATHPYGFRCGEWAEILTIAPDPEGRDCYVVRFSDGVTDYWPTQDASDPYEFREPLSSPLSPVPPKEETVSSYGREVVGHVMRRGFPTWPETRFAVLECGHEQRVGTDSSARVVTCRKCQEEGE